MSKPPSTVSNSSDSALLKVLRRQLRYLESQADVIRHALAEVEKALGTVAPAVSGVRVTIPEAMVSLLESSEVPLSVLDIVEGLKGLGYVTTVSTVQTILSRKRELFERADKGLYRAAKMPNLAPGGTSSGAEEAKS